MVQFRRDIELLRGQLESKDEVIRLHEKKIKVLIEANCTLRNGMHHHMPRPQEDESEEENSLGPGGPVPNGVDGANVQNDLAKFIKQLDL